jgi:hypothetical protein
LQLNSDNWDIVVGAYLGDLPDDPRLFDFVRLCQFQAIEKNGPAYHMLLTRKEANIRSFKDLAGKVMTVKTMLPGLREMFEKENLPWGGSSENGVVVYVNTGSDYLHDIKHCTYTWASHARKVLEQHPGAFDVLATNLASTYVCDPYYVCASMVRRGALNEKKSAVERALRVLDEAGRFVRERPDEARAVIPDFFTAVSKESAMREELPSYKSTSETISVENLKRVHWSRVNNLEDYCLILSKTAPK